MNRADRWLHRELRALRERHDDGDDVHEALERALAGLEALQAAGVLDAAASDQWRAAFYSDAGIGPQPHLTPAAEQFLAELLETLEPDPEGMHPAVQRFEGALHMLAVIGAVDPRDWDAKQRARLGWESAEEELAVERELNAGGTEAELLQVIPGPGEVRQGHRLLLAMRFADGVSFVIDKDAVKEVEVEWPDWDLRDDAGTAYRQSGAGGGGHDEHVSFRTPVPPEARWLELSLATRPGVSFRVQL